MANKTQVTAYPTDSMKSWLLMQSKRSGHTVSKIIIASLNKLKQDMTAKELSVFLKELK